MENKVEMRNISMMNNNGWKKRAPKNREKNFMITTIIKVEKYSSVPSNKSNVVNNLSNKSDM